MDTTTTIDITPTDEGFTNIAAVLGQSILDSARSTRMAPTREQLVSIVEIAAYLGSKGKGDLVEELKARIGTYLPR